MGRNETHSRRAKKSCSRRLGRRPRAFCVQRLARDGAGEARLDLRSDTPASATTTNRIHSARVRRHEQRRRPRPGIDGKRDCEPGHRVGPPARPATAARSTTPSTVNRSTRGSATSQNRDAECGLRPRAPRRAPRKRVTAVTAGPVSGRGSRRAVPGDEVEADGGMRSAAGEYRDEREIKREPAARFSRLSSS